MSRGDAQQHKTDQRWEIGVIYKVENVRYVMIILYHLPLEAHHWVGSAGHITTVLGAVI